MSELISILPMNNQTISWDLAITAYLRHLDACGRTAGTRRIHKSYANMLRSTGRTPADVTTSSIERMFENRTWKPETRKSARAVARSFFDWCHKNDLTDSNPALSLSSVRVPESHGRPAPTNVVQDAIAETDDERVKLMIRFAAYAGLRCCEICKIKSSDWNGELLEVVGKNQRRRQVPILSPRLKDALVAANGYLFPGQVDGHLSAGYVSKLIGRALPTGTTAHQLRHRFATAAYEGTRDLLAVSALLGHSKPETTRRYVAMPMESLFAAVKAAS